MHVIQKKLTNEDWKAKLESAHSFMLEFSKIAVLVDSDGPAGFQNNFNGIIFNQNYNVKTIDY